MHSLNATQFKDFFQAVNGHEPYAWQNRLAKQVISDEKWPRAVDMPTGTGKTSLLDIAIYALAAKPEIFPRRIFFVIDRRIVVDQVSLRAQKIAEVVEKSLKSSKKSSKPDAIKKVSENLREISGNDLLEDEAPLGVAALRGGIPLDKEWTQRPDRPWAITTTVDQFGSRLLFRGYGASRGARPINAGLCGNDCLIILDEIHLARPFSQTLQDVTSSGEYTGIDSIGEDSELPRRLQIVEMSATSPAKNKAAEGTFKYSEEELSKDSRFAQIVKAQKRIFLSQTTGGKDIQKWFPKTVLGLLTDLQPHERSIGVIVNRVQTAREINTALLEKGYDSVLLTGRMRPLDKRTQLEAVKSRTDPDRGNGEQPEEQKPLVTVATQTIEVGADFSFDALITEVAPIDSLVQRLGRLNRRGNDLGEDQAAARCWVVGSEKALKEPDFVYGEASKQTWEALQELFIDEESGIPAGSIELTEVLDSGHFREDCFAPHKDAPILLPTHIEAWVQTNPQPNVEPEIAPFLHGMQDSDERRLREVSLIWRHDISSDVLEQVPPAQAEMLVVPLHAVVGWLHKQEESAISDVDNPNVQDVKKARGKAQRDKAQNQDTEQPKRIAVWRSRVDSDESRLRWVEIDQIAEGDVLVLSPDRGGLAGGTWDPTPWEKLDGDSEKSNDEVSKPEGIQDLGDAAQWESRRQCTLRLDPRPLASIRPPLPSMPTPAEELNAEIPAAERITDWLQEASQALKDAELSSEFAWVKEVIAHLAEKGGWSYTEIDPSGDKQANYFVLRRGTDPEDGRWSETGAGTLLDDHLKGVGEVAAEFAKRLGLSDELVMDFRLAGELHDIGKVDRRFQMKMVGNDPVTNSGLTRPLAKSLSGTRTTRDGWPPVRHEVSSLALISSNDKVISLANDKDLVLHLVSSHHGYGRPIPPIKFDSEPDDMQFSYTHNDEVLEMEASTDLAGSPLAIEIIERFWRLHAKYGHHGLAWLEAIFRLADQRRSMLEAQGAVKGNATQ